jgi:hypothetical protein
MKKQTTINHNDLEIAKQWLKEETANITRIIPHEVYTLFNLIDLYTDKDAELYTYDKGVDSYGNYLFSSEYDCPNCGKEVKSWYKFCPKCGQKIIFKQGE